MKKPWELGIVGSNCILLEGLAGIFRGPAFNVAFACRSIEEIWELGPAVPKISAMMIDIEQQKYPSNEDIRRLRDEFPESRIIFMADSTNNVDVAHFVGSGVDGLVVKSRCVEAIVKTVELALLGERVFPVEAIHQHSPIRDEQSCNRAIQPDVIYNMSSREVEVLKSLSKGRANKEIARHLGISEATVKVHVKAILRKSRARNRTEAAMWATGVGLAGEPSRCFSPSAAQEG